LRLRGWVIFEVVDSFHYLIIWLKISLNNNEKEWLSSDMSWVLIEVTVPWSSQHLRSKGLDNIKMSYSINFILGDSVLIENIWVTFLRVKTPVFVKPPGHRCNEETTHESSSKPEARESSIKSHCECSNQRARKHMVKI